MCVCVCVCVCACAKDQEPDEERGGGGGEIVGRRGEEIEDREERRGGVHIHVCLSLSVCVCMQGFMYVCVHVCGLSCPNLLEISCVW